MTSGVPSPLAISDAPSLVAPPAVSFPKEEAGTTGPGPEIRVVKHTVKGHTATIVVSVPTAGKLVATGNGVSKGSGKAGKAQDVTVKLTLSKKDQALLAAHHGRKVKVDVKLAFTPKKGSKLSNSVTVSIG
jgi:hypothetical protein